MHEYNSMKKHDWWKKQSFHTKKLQVENVHSSSDRKKRESGICVSDSFFSSNFQAHQKLLVRTFTQKRWMLDFCSSIWKLFARGFTNKSQI